MPDADEHSTRWRYERPRVGIGMTADEYVLRVVGKYSVATGPWSRSERVGQAIAPLTRNGGEVPSIGFPH